MPLLLTLALQAVGIVPDAVTFDLATSSRSSPTEVTGCGAASEDIVVCGGKRDLYRLPLPTEREPSSDRGRGDSANGVAAMTPVGRCGIFAGERLCSKREAAQYGYGNGRDPITILSRLAKKVVDPDAN